MWTDGACSGNPGPGGWGVLLRYGAHEKGCMEASLQPQIIAWNDGGHPRAERFEKPL